MNKENRKADWQIPRAANPLFLLCSRSLSISLINITLIVIHRLRGSLLLDFQIISLVVKKQEDHSWRAIKGHPQICCLSWCCSFICISSCSICFKPSSKRNKCARRKSSREWRSRERLRTSFLIHFHPRVYVFQGLSARDSTVFGIYTQHSTAIFCLHQRAGRQILSATT